MSSSVFFKFRSSKEPQRITFDGNQISVYEVKREIITLSGLGDGTDFDLHIYDESNPTEEYDDDTTLLSRGSQVIATRRPAARPGHGKAARYLTGKAPMNAKNLSRAEQIRSNAPAKASPATKMVADMSKAQTEDERIKAMLAAEGSQWEQQRQQMASAKPVYYKNPAHRRHVNSDKPLPPGYICHRCQEKGHWIQDCPTNDDPNFEPKPRLKRTTGIPKTFIKAAPKTNGAGTNDGLTSDAQAGTVMLDAEGNQVVVVPDSESWKKFEQKHKAAVAAQQEAAAGSEGRELQERGLLCPIDNRLFVDPMKTPCCEKTYCHDCIENTLLDTDLVCPNCGQHSVLIDNLKTDDVMVAKIADYEREKVEREKAAKGEKAAKAENFPERSPEPSKKEPTNSPKADSVKSPKSPQDDAVKSPSAQPSLAASDSNVGTPTTSAASTASSKKRSAPDDPDWANVPTGPAAMRKQPSQPQQQAQQNMQSMQNMQPFPQQMQIPPFQQFPMAPMAGPFPMQSFPMQPQFPFNNNFYGQQNPMGNMNMNMNMNWQQQMPFQGGQHQQQQNGYRQFNKQPNPQHEDSAYLRQPVNPRNQHRNKRARPCDYTTLS